MSLKKMVLTHKVCVGWDLDMPVKCSRCGKPISLGTEMTFFYGEVNGPMHWVCATKKACEEAPKGRWMTSAEIEQEAKKLAREHLRGIVQGVLEGVKELWREALADPKLFETKHAKKKKKRKRKIIEPCDICGSTDETCDCGNVNVREK